jgi:hypothetical protein
MALIELNKNHFTVNATVHEAFLISIPINEFDERLEEAKKIMVTAAERVVGPIRVGAEIIRGNFKQKPEVQKDFDEIFNEIQNYKTYTNVATGPTYTEVAIQPSPLE